MQLWADWNRNEHGRRRQCCDVARLASFASQSTESASYVVSSSFGNSSGIFLLESFYGFVTTYVQPVCFLHN